MTIADQGIGERLRRQGMKKLKQRRWAGTIAIGAAAVALAAPAFASGATYTGALKGGGTLSFKTTDRNGKIVGVKAFGWKQVPASCDQGAYSYATTLPFGLAVKSRAFAITATGGGIVQQVTGLFTANHRRASGILDVYGDLAPGRTNCSTGKLHWSATRR
jgi:hypothetical protein